jgi:hypothetical protein
MSQSHLNVSINQIINQLSINQSITLIKMSQPAFMNPDMSFILTEVKTGENILLTIFQSLLLAKNIWIGVGFIYIWSLQSNKRKRCLWF